MPRDVEQLVGAWAAVMRPTVWSTLATAMPSWYILAF